MPALTIETSTGARFRALLPRPLSRDEAAALDARLEAALRDAADPERAVLAAMEAERRRVEVPNA